MRNLFYYKILLLVFSFLASVKAFSQSGTLISSDTSLIYPFSNTQTGGIFLNNPPNISSTVTYDLTTNQYFIQEKTGELKFGNPLIMNFNEYQLYNMNRSISDYWNLRSKERIGKQFTSFGLPKLYIPGKAFDRIFGGNAVDIRPQGSAELIFALRVNRLDNPNYTVKQRKTISFDFQEKIQMNVIGKIGEKLKLTTNFNNFKINY